MLIAGCPTRGWPDGLWGRRDAFLIVLTHHLGYAHPAARDLQPNQLALREDDDGAFGGEVQRDDEAGKAGADDHHRGRFRCRRAHGAGRRAARA